MYYHILPLLYFKKQKEEEVIIILRDSLKNEEKIASDDIPDFEKVEFEIADSKGEQDKFTLHFLIKKNQSGQEAKTFIVPIIEQFVIFQKKDSI